MREPEIAHPAANGGPGGIFVGQLDWIGDEGFILDDQGDHVGVGRQGAIGNHGLHGGVLQHITGSLTAIYVQAGDAIGMVVVEHQTGALLVGVEEGHRTRTGIGHIGHVNRADTFRVGRAFGSGGRPLVGGTIADPGGDAAMQMQGGAVLGVSSGGCADPAQGSGGIRGGAAARNDDRGGGGIQGARVGDMQAVNHPVQDGGCCGGIHAGGSARDRDGRDAGVACAAGEDRNTGHFTGGAHAGAHRGGVHRDVQIASHAGWQIVVKLDAGGLAVASDTGGFGGIVTAGQNDRPEVLRFVHGVDRRTLVIQDRRYAVRVEQLDVSAGHDGRGDLHVTAQSGWGQIGMQLLGILDHCDLVIIRARIGGGI